MLKNITDTTMRGNGMTFAFDDGSVAEVIFQWVPEEGRFKIFGAENPEELELVQNFLIEENVNLHVVDEDAASNSPNSIGNLSNLNTTDTSNFVAALNEVNTNANDANNNIGPLASLSTADKSSLVAALNEVRELAERSQFTQSTPLTPWVINHNRGYRPAINVYTPSGKEVLAEIVQPSTNQTLIYFDTPFAGFATLN